ncbi:VVA0879 family protein [Nocardia africana]|uniref:Uncharacterized protein n=1 Tax=Nocardia africana TaxID=134964 RepID=A0A378X3D1_9NOCA|nr:VVA0879 family protein [Nocardia africana]MCC3311494.1 hypothetical protein [Nocardia africana]SUA47244.1 Uncharacterised protein [Nocardia africana]
MPDTKTTWTQQELVDEARRRFGDDHWTWAFRCPSCGDIATARDFKDAGAAPELIGQECIGRHLGALKGPPTTDGGRSIATRGCDWAAYGLFSGPWSIVMPDGHKAPSFPLAEAVSNA